MPLSCKRNQKYRYEKINNKPEGTVLGGQLIKEGCPGRTVPSGSASPLGLGSPRKVVREEPSPPGLHSGPGRTSVKIIMIKFIAVGVH